jgi:hypothetical protein
LRTDAPKPPDVFRFEATRFTARLRAVGGADPSETLYRTKFEVQIRSAFEHAWSVTTHAIYKGGQTGWKVRRLAAQLKAAVEQLDSLVLGFEASSDRIVEHEWPEVDVQARILEKFSTLFEKNKIPELMVPKDWSRFCENFYKLIGASSRAPRHREDRVCWILESMECFEKELESPGFGGIPVSLSLLQVVFGILATHGIITPPLFKFCPLVTDGLVEFYPKTSVFSDRFSFAD